MSPLQRLPPFEEWPALGEVLNDMIDRINVLSSIRGGPNIKLHYTPGGISIEGTAEAEVSSARLQFRGEYSFTFSYAAGDIVRVSVGSEAGTYICIEAVAANEGTDPGLLPWSGATYWVLIGRLADQSSWT